MECFILPFGGSHADWVKDHYNAKIFIKKIYYFIYSWVLDDFNKGQKRQDLIAGKDTNIAKHYSVIKGFITTKAQFTEKGFRSTNNNHHTNAITWKEKNLKKIFRLFNTTMYIYTSIHSDDPSEIPCCLFNRKSIKSCISDFDNSAFWTRGINKLTLIPSRLTPKKKIIYFNNRIK